jgi:hypothetical protein
MKLPLKPIGLAVALAFASAAANAQLSTPQYGTSPPSTTSNNTLILFLWSPVQSGSPNSGYGEEVSLNYNYTQLTAASGSLTPNSATSPFVTAANPTGAAGNVLQLNFGTVPNFAQMTPTGGGPVDYFIGASNGLAETAFEITDSTTPTTSQLPPAGIGVVSKDIQTISWNGTGGNTGVDTTGAAAYNPIASTVNSGSMNGLNFGGAVGTALNFYNAYITTVNRVSTSNIVQYANANGAGFWYLSSSGDLTWNVPLATVGAVPLPAAFWLFASGIAGLGAIARRRRQGLGGAAAA